MGEEEEAVKVLSHVGGGKEKQPVHGNQADKAPDILRIGNLFLECLELTPFVYISSCMQVDPKDDDTTKEAMEVVELRGKLSLRSIQFIDKCIHSPVHSPYQAVMTRRRSLPQKQILVGLEPLPPIQVGGNRCRAQCFLERSQRGE